MNTVTLETTKLTTVDLTPRIGTELKIDKETLLSGEHAAEIREILERRGVVIVRNLGLTKDEQRALARKLGKLQLQGEDGIYPITLDPKIGGLAAEYLKGAFYWHIDGASDDVPNLAAMLTARVLSPTGGETEFANTYAAWEDLPADEKRRYEGLRVMHALESSQLMVTPEPSLDQLEDWRTKDPYVQPLVWTHQSGRKSLVVGATALYILDKTPEESRYILTKLRDWATRPQFVYQHQWRMGDLLIWDNTGTMHRVLPYDMDCGRRLHRFTLNGEEAVVGATRQ
jgi:alpha-ketoglutarate-dependent taurine dioxygenase